MAIILAAIEHAEALPIGVLQSGLENFRVACYMPCLALGNRIQDSGFCDSIHLHIHCGNTCKDDIGLGCFHGSLLLLPCLLQYNFGMVIQSGLRSISALTHSITGGTQKNSPSSAGAEASASLRSRPGRTSSERKTLPL